MGRFRTGLRIRALTVLLLAVVSARGVLTSDRICIESDGAVHGSCEGEACCATVTATGVASPEMASGAELSCPPAGHSCEGCTDVEVALDPIRDARTVRESLGFAGALDGIAAISFLATSSEAAIADGDLDASMTSIASSISTLPDPHRSAILTC